MWWWAPPNPQLSCLDYIASSFFLVCLFVFFVCLFFFNLALFKLAERSMTVINFQRSSKIAFRSHAKKPFGMFLKWCTRRWRHRGSLARWSQKCTLCFNNPWQPTEVISGDPSTCTCWKTHPVCRQRNIEIPVNETLHRLQLHLLWPILQTWEVSPWQG